MGILETIRNSAVDALVESGAATLNALYPAEFQYNVVSLELTDSTSQNTIDFFSFPINPSGIAYVEPEVTNVKKTLGGVVAITNNSFVPKNVSLNGTFGRSFKLITSRLNAGSFSSFKSFAQSFVNVRRTPQKETYRYDNGLGKSEFSKVVKNGYGCIRLMQFIIDAAGDLDENGKSNLLFLHNNAFGESWLVKPISKTFTINEGRNIYDYAVQFKIVAPAKAVYKNFMNDPRSAARIVAPSAIQRDVKRNVKAISKIITSL